MNWSMAGSKWASVTPAAAAPVGAGVELGGLTLERRLGRHALADRWLARDRARGEPFVAYRVDLLAGARGEKRFRLAVEMLTSLRHPHVCPVLWFETEAAGGRWVVSPYVGGPGGITTVAEVARERDGGILSPTEVCSAVEQVLGLMAYAHARGFCHGRIGAEDLIVDRRGAVVAELYGLSRRLRGLPAADGATCAEEVRSLAELARTLLLGAGPSAPWAPIGAEREPHAGPDEGALIAWLRRALGRDVPGFRSADDALRRLRRLREVSLGGMRGIPVVRRWRRAMTTRRVAMAPAEPEDARRQA